MILDGRVRESPCRPLPFSPVGVLGGDGAGAGGGDEGEGAEAEVEGWGLVQRNCSFVTRRSECDGTLQRALLPITTFKNTRYYS